MKLQSHAPVCELQLFGIPTLRVDGRDGVLALKRAPALLGYLAHCARRVPRTHLAALLWPEAGEPQARSRLRRLTYEIERAVGGRLFDADDEAIAVLPGRLQVDLLAFGNEARDAVMLPALDDATAQRMLRWMDLASRPLLEGQSFGSESFDDWVKGQRIELDHLLARLIDRLVDWHAGRGDIDEGLRLTERLLAMDPYHEPHYILLMRLHERRGHAAGVEAAFTRCADALRAEYGIKPSARTEETYVGIVEALRRKASDRLGERFRVQFAESPFGTVAYAALGNAPDAIVVAPGFVSNIEIGWEQPRIRDFLTTLARRFRVIVFDRRGVGLSERLDASASAAATAADIVAILNHAGIERAWVFGSSEGGPAAIKLAVQQASRVRGLVLFGAMAKGCADTDYPWALPAPAFDVWLQRLVAAWGGPAGIETFAPTQRDDPTLRAWWGRMLRCSTSPGGMRVILEGLRNVDVRSDLPRVTVPTLVMHRRGDRAVRVDAGAHLAAQIPGAEWRPLDGDDHWWWCGDWERVAQEVVAFAGSRAA
jgi:pimeloyl-ACP methyl ester carboxylesterase/DNA-binding SARP family transcriptional activator